MRGFNKLLVIVGFLFLGLSSCEKDIVVINAFDFEIAVNQQEITTINYPQTTTFSILPEKPLIGDRYFFSYVLLEGAGAYIIDGQPVSQSEYIEIEDIEEVLEADFVSSTLGIKKVRVEFNNNGKVIKTVDLIYDVRHNPYSLIMTSPIVDYVENQVIPIKVNLQNVGVDDEVTYKRAFFLLEGEGSLERVGGVPITLEEYEPIVEGEINYSLIMTTLGSAKFLVRTIDSNGQIKEAMLMFNGFSDELAFTVDTNPNHDELFVNDEFDFIFEIQPTAGQTTKRMQYTIRTSSSGDNDSIIVKNSNGEVVPINTFVDVPDSGVFNWTGLSTIPQTNVIITFTLQSEDGMGQMEEVERDLLPPLSFQEGSFIIDALPLSVDNDVNAPAGISFSIMDFGASTGPYTIRFTSDQGGELRVNNMDFPLTASEVETILYGDITNSAEQFMLYTGSVLGDHAIRVQLQDSEGRFSNLIDFIMVFE